MDNPLISIVVITYNSSDYILAGLESIKEQTYKNIEVIISDDCSTDTTIEICRKWLNENKSFFQRVELVTTLQNTGVAGNLNRGIQVAKGEWIKVLSGDDNFFPFTIDRYVNFALNNPQAEVIFGKLHIYGSDRSLVKECKEYYESILYPKIRLDQKKQYRENLKSLFVPGPGLFYKKSLLDLVGGFDERYQFCEEDPLMFKIFQAKKRVYFLDDEVYSYQVLKGSLAREQTTLSRHMTDRMRFFRDYRRFAMLKAKLYLYVIDESIQYQIMEENQRGNKVGVLFYKTLYLLSPLRHINFIGRVLTRISLSPIFF